MTANHLRRDCIPIVLTARSNDLSRAPRQPAPRADPERPVRALQRLFADYVGVGPKWVIQRFRILEAAAAALSDAPVDWAGLAQELGFSDQAHLTRVFSQVVGTPPAAYRRDPGT